MYTALKETESRSTDILPLWKVPLISAFIPRQQKAQAAVALIRKTTTDLIEKCKAMVDAEEEVRKVKSWSFQSCNASVTWIERIQVALDLKGQRFVSWFSPPKKCIISSLHPNWLRICEWLLFRYSWADILGCYYQVYFKFGECEFLIGKIVKVDFLSILNIKQTWNFDFLGSQKGLKGTLSREQLYTRVENEPLAIVL